ncbi:MAG: FlgD immunoglobulin-like domain containing protein [Candidatus Marinimicrobia bacterium]|nr:FlgD immunoglobulin-like domain containing protein [Candidatus Neomarinimicrobiota bacterium]
MSRNSVFRFIAITFILVIAGFASLSAQTDNVTFTNFPQQKWVLMGFPITPNNTNPDSIFNKYFNVAGTDWRFSRWNIGHQTYIRWNELDLNPAGETENWGDPETIRPGFGYWMYQTPTQNANVSVTGTLIPQTTDYYIPIDPPQGSYAGITMVANPFNFPTDWKNTYIKVTEGNKVTELTLEQASVAGVIDPYAYKWDVENGVYIPYHRTAGGVFDIWDGYWVEQVMPSCGELVVCKTEGVHSGDKTYPHAIKFHDDRVGGKGDCLGEDFVQETERYNFIVSGAGGTCSVETRADGTYQNSCNLTVGSSFTDNNGFKVECVGIEPYETVAGYYIYRFDVTSLSMSKKQGLSQITFDFVDGDVYVPDVPAQSGGNDPHEYHSYTTFRYPYTTKASKTVLASIELKIPAINAGAKSLAKKADHYPVVSSAMSIRDWFVPVSIFNADSSVRDDYNGFGIMSDASDNYDVNDAKNFSPMFSKYVDVYFKHDDINELTNYWWERPTKVCYDVRSDSASKTWNMTVMSGKTPNTTFTLRWDAQSITDEWSVELIDVANQVTIDMKTQNSYQFTTSADSGYVKTMFQITAVFLPFSKVENETQPVHFGLSANYPNPFNSTTVIPFVLEKPAMTTLSIYTMNGKLVRTLTNERLSAGKYELKWNGTNQSGKPVSSGIYIYRLTSGGRTEMKKMSFVK